MEIPLKRLKNGFQLPVLGLGTWRMAGDYWSRNTASNDEADVAAIRRAIDAGVRHIDTAEMYADGHAEELVGQAISGRDRSQLFLTSKVWHNHLRHDDLIHSAEASLKRIKTGYLDLYLIHWPNPQVPLAESIGALDELADRGLTRAIGVSNFSLELLTQAQAIARHPIVTNQVQYNLVERHTESSGLLDYCQRHDVLLTAWRPLQDVLKAPANSVLQRICEKYGKTRAQVALNWLTSQPHIVTIAKMQSAEHLAENLGAVDWTLDSEDIEFLRREFPAQLDAARAPPRA